MDLQSRLWVPYIQVVRWISDPPYLAEADTEKGQ